MKITDKQLAEVLWELCRDAHGGNALERSTAVFVRYLGRIGRIRSAGGIAEALADLERTRKGITQVTVRSAFPLSSALTAALVSHLGISKAEIIGEQDSSSIGGAQVRARDFIWDGSLRTQLKRLAAHLASN